MKKESNDGRILVLSFEGDIIGSAAGLEEAVEEAWRLRGAGPGRGRVLALFDTEAEVGRACLWGMDCGGRFVESGWRLPSGVATTGKKDGGAVAVAGAGLAVAVERVRLRGGRVLRVFTPGG